MPMSFRRVERCRVCRSRDLVLILSLGETPLANAFLRPEDLDRPEPRYPLELLRCGDCGLAQLSVVVSPEVLFRHYLYASSASPPLHSHFDALAEELVERFAPAGSFVVEAGSNDGILLRPLRARGVAAVGVEPAADLAAVANQAGLETWNEFFGEPVARKLVTAKGRAAVCVANNVLAHIDDLHDILRALDALLADDGVFVAEVPYIADLLDHVEYDTIYHEHLSYFGIRPLARLFSQGGLSLFDVRRLPIHGGSIRIYVCREGRRAASRATADLLDLERRAGLDDGAAYARFAERVAESRRALLALLAELVASGKRIAGYGATAKGNTLLNYCGIGSETLEFVADTTPLKQGLLTPGTRIPVRPESALAESRPDYALLLAWNYADAIIRRHAGYLESGGRFIHPIPVARVI